MQWNSTQVFDLTSFTCVNSWNTTSSVLLSDSQFRISSFCRSFDYYVDPTSTAVVELGTMQFPYKSLPLVFVEMLNYHANTNRTINIYLKENTESYVDLGFNYIINMTTVNMKSYSSTSSSSSKATIIAGEQNSPSLVNITEYFNNWTSFNLLKNTQLRIKQQILSSFSKSEINYLSQTSQVFTVHRTNFTIDNMVLRTEFDNINSGYTIRNTCVSTGNSSSSEAKPRWKDGRGFNSAQRPLLIPLNRLLNFWSGSDEFEKQARTRKVTSTVRGYLYPVHRTPTDDPIYGRGNGQGEGR